MNWAFELLSLSLDADLVSIKRAYARLLRTTRPDEDPAGFQRLHAAYKLALAHASEQPTEPANAVKRGSQSSEALNQVQWPPVPFAAPAPAPAPVPVPVPAPVPASTPSAPPVAAPISNVAKVPAHVSDPSALAQTVIRSAVEAQSGDALARWLERRLEFWSIPVKQQTGQLVLNTLFQQPQAMSVDCLDALLQFFDLNHVLAGVNPIALRALRARQTTLWELLPANHRELAKRMRLMWGSQPDIVSLRKDIALLQRPFSWLRTAWIALRPNRALGFGRLARTLLGSNDRLDELPPSIDRHHAHFWLHASANAAMTWQRFSLGSLRIGIVALALSCLMGSMPILSAVVVPEEGLWHTAITTAGATAIIVFAIWLLYSGCIWLDYWQGLAEATPTRKPWLRWFVIPLLCAIELLFDAGDASFFVMMPISMAILVLAARRLCRRTGTRPIPATTTLIILSVITAFLLTHLQECVDFHAAALTSLIACVLWATDLWRHRAYIHPKLARN